MITIPAETIRERIRAQTGMTDAQIDMRVKDKLTTLSGLISKDGALHILANELGVKLAPDRDKLKTKDVLVGMRVTLNLRVMKIYEVRQFQREGRSGSVGSFLAGDETGVIRVTLWNEQSAKLAELTEGATVQVKEATVKENQGRKELHLGTGSELVVDPPGVTVTVNAGAQERSFAKKKIGELAATDEFVDVLGTIVQVFDPRTFTKKTGEQGLVANAVIDDGTGTIRASFWDNDCKTLLGDAATQPDRLADIKLELLGQIVKVQGRCKLNAAYNTLEISVANFVRNPDPASEMQRLG